MEFPKFLNEKDFLTREGQHAHDLVQNHKLVSAHHDPEQNLDLSPDYLKKLEDQIKEAGKLLGIPEDEHMKEQIIFSFEKKLEKEGHPFWRDKDAR